MPRPGEPHQFAPEYRFAAISRGVTWYVGPEGNKTVEELDAIGYQHPDEGEQLELELDDNDDSETPEDDG